MNSPLKSTQTLEKRLSNKYVAIILCLKQLQKFKSKKLVYRDNKMFSCHHVDFPKVEVTDDF